MVSLWTILTAIAPILAPIISLILVLIGRIIWNHEKRIRSLEQAEKRHGRTIYGDDDDIQQAGLAHDISDLIKRLDRVENKIDELHTSRENE